MGVVTVTRVKTWKAILHLFKAALQKEASDVYMFSM